VAQALRYGATDITVAEINGALVDLVRDGYAGENGGLLRKPEVHVEVVDGRVLAAGNPGRYDMVVVSFLDASGLSFPGSKSVSENYLYTGEALRSFLDALGDGGLLVLSARTEEPPRASLRLFASLIVTAREAWGAEAARSSLAFVKSQFHGMALARKGGFDDLTVGRLSDECASYGFTLSFYPGMERGTLEQRAAEEDAFWAKFKDEEGVDLSGFESGTAVQDPYYDAAQALLYSDDSGADYLDAYPFDLSLTTDDRPYFSAMLKAGSLDFIKRSAYNPEHWEREIPPDLWAQPLVFATLGQAVLFASLILLLPLLAARKRIARSGKLRTFVYFSCLAVGFMFVEMVLIQKFTLYVAAPAYAAAIVLSGMLVFSGVGAACSGRLPGRRGIGIAVAAIAALSILYNFALTPLLTATMGLPEWARLSLAIVAVAPAAFFLGMPFPLALSAMSSRGDTDLAAWGWAVNGAVSVVGVVLAQGVAMSFGFPAVLWAVAGVYALALGTFPDSRKRGT